MRRDTSRAEFEGVADARNLRGCGDNNCLIRRPQGMATNGGCRCPAYVWVTVARHLRRQLRDVKHSGVELDDPRIPYVTVQIDRDLWENLP